MKKIILINVVAAGLWACKKENIGIKDESEAKSLVYDGAAVKAKLAGTWVKSDTCKRYELISFIPNCDSCNFKPKYWDELEYLKFNENGILVYKTSDNSNFINSEYSLISSSKMNLINLKNQSFKIDNDSILGFDLLDTPNIYSVRIFSCYKKIAK